MGKDDGNSDSDSNNSNNSSSNQPSEEELKQEAYDQAFKAVGTKVAFLYKSEDWENKINEKLTSTLKLQDEYKKFFIASLKIFIVNKEYQIDGKTTKFIEDNIVEVRARDKNLLISEDIKKIVENCLAKTLNINNSQEVEQIIDTIFNETTEELFEYNKNQAYVLACPEYFNRDYESLGKEGMVYQPPQEKHKWIYNANWLLGHFDKGTDTFIVKSAITEENKLRKENPESTGKPGSGFLREIAICAKFGYTLQRDVQSNIILKHDNPSVLKGKTLEEITSISIDDMTIHYNKIMQEYKTLVLQSKSSQPSSSSSLGKRLTTCDAAWPFSTSSSSGGEPKTDSQTTKKPKTIQDDDEEERPRNPSPY